MISAVKLVIALSLTLLSLRILLQSRTLSLTPTRFLYFVRGTGGGIIQCSADTSSGAFLRASGSEHNEMK